MAPGSGVCQDRRDPEPLRGDRRGEHPAKLFGILLGPLAEGRTRGACPCKAWPWHPAMASGLATLRELKDRPPYDRLERLSARLADGLAAAATEAGVPHTVARAGSM